MSHEMKSYYCIYKISVILCTTYTMISILFNVKLPMLCTKLSSLSLKTSHLITLASPDLGYTTRRMMREVMKNGVMALYSLKGRNGKKVFQDLFVSQVLHLKYLCGLYYSYGTIRTELILPIPDESNICKRELNLVIPEPANAIVINIVRPSGGTVLTTEFMISQEMSCHCQC